MRFLPFVVFIFPTLFGFAALSDDLNNTGVNRDITSDTNTGLTYHFRLLDIREFNRLTLLTPENLRLNQILFPNFTLDNDKFDWLKWVELTGNVKSRTLFGGFPFINMRVENGEASPFFSTHSFFLLWYFNKKF